MKTMSLFFFAGVLMWQAAFASGASPWTDPVKAAAEYPDFLIQGEYTGNVEGKPVGLQAAALDGGQFLVSVYRGGLPGEGWDRSPIASQSMTRDALKQKLAGLKRVERVSKTMGRKAPEGASIFFAGENKMAFVKGAVREGVLWPPAATTQAVGDFEMHLEFRLPFKPNVPLSHQDRGNSGIYIYDNYECQIIDSFALDLVKENNPIKLHSDSKQWCGALYTFKLPDVPMVYPPLQWQTYDIDFTAPVFVDGKKTKNARITLIHNGVKVHDNVELPKGTGAGASRPEKAAGTINFQDHGNPVAFRNVWIKAKQAAPAPAGAE